MNLEPVSKNKVSKITPITPPNFAILIRPNYPQSLFPSFRIQIRFEPKKSKKEQIYFLISPKLVLDSWYSSLIIEFSSGAGKEGGRGCLSPAFDKEGNESRRREGSTPKMKMLPCPLHQPLAPLALSKR
jgi:hypothetical protein